MSDAKTVKFPLKIVINKQGNKVLFAEADSDFVDVLLSFLTLPLGKIVQVLEKHNGKAPIIGSLSSLYNGVKKLDIDHFWTEGGKKMLLDPRSSFDDECRKLKLDINDYQPAKYFACERWPKCRCIGIYYGTTICDCGKTLKNELSIKNVSEADDVNDGAFTIKKGTFLISDDLQILPNVTASVIQILSKLGITDADWGEIKNVNFGIYEIMKLLNDSFLIQTPLTSVIFNNIHLDTATPEFEPEMLINGMEKKSTSHSKKMILNVIVQKSTNRLLFAESQEDFVDFLFSLLTIPLGGAEFLLDGNTCLKTIDNLYRSVTNVMYVKFFKSPDTKNKLIQPKLPPGYRSNQFLPLAEEKERVHLCQDNLIYTVYSESNFKTPKGGEYYVKAPGMFMVTDNLIVTPLCISSYVSTLNRLKIPISDVTELVLHIGQQEALNILKAALTSSSALSKGLSPLLMKQPKQEL